MLVGAAFALYPIRAARQHRSGLQPDHREHKDRRAWNGVGLVWWSIGMVIAIWLLRLLFRMFRGKVNLDEGGSMDTEEAARKLMSTWSGRSLDSN